ncbi:sigma-70 family RNA polymerase sigma factor [Cytobacillus gottheilii]|uniref:sigma-70 family RNA polymerase sigma factor n=1 Tax=Cytobacillus gottheilii TaxID=859144 RepID=UPI0009BBB425|nr:sigma-70 family RNA polymerase sigma factor [Cytobacillus gottheilii]
MDSFEMVIKQYEPLLYKLMNTLNIYQDRDEFYQLGLISLWEAWSNFDSSKGKFISYAYPYIRGRFLQELKKVIQKQQQHTYPDAEYMESIKDSTIPHSLELLNILPYCECLTVKQRKWVIYTFIQGLSVQQIADQESVSVSAVKQWRTGAKKELRKRWSAEEELGIF